jgi:hypothetical protein
MLVGCVVRYDAPMSTRTSQADLILKLKSESENKYTRLRYAPDGFSFDAPPASRDKLLPKEMFSDGHLMWTFRVHTPRNSEEATACKFRAKEYGRDKHGKLNEVERFAPVPGHENDKTPKLESLSCFVIEGWSKAADTVEPADR